MGSMTLLFFVEHVFIFCMIFWLLTWVAEYFFKSKNNKQKHQFYECGIRALSELNIQINLNFSIVCVFLILYDVEFIFMYPFFFNFFLVNAGAFLVFFVFLFFVFYSLVYDSVQNSLALQL
uniref:NADH-ubiquinone oxidoreductase chain 3 n=1 Tax=Paramecium tetraurelia TaxID=5888 RepID=NU3M_PARTE|nr:unnamed protein product [Paramecium aurelia]P15579.1 RecName: Full=NADH-ubiquinone oxidoreductase chain 3; AltName: Full=NADH dehydrogenase subunit 3 [Paramecium tetraurelia]AAA79262.1 unknown protein [Paramecium tetraurelia]CAA34036.1 unnamed protein product [Paramecium aurelia]